MANWLTIKHMSEKYGVDESLLREWNTSGYIAFSIIGEVGMLEEASFLRYLEMYKEEEVREESSARLIRKKKQEREMILSTLNDRLFLLKTQSFYQPLFHLLLQELGGLLDNDRQREIFLAISCGEPLPRLAYRYGISYDKAVETYLSVFNILAEEANKISLLRQQFMAKLCKPVYSYNLLYVPLEELFEKRIARIFREEKDITTVDELLIFVSRHGWKGVKNIPGLGERSYQIVIS